MNENNSGTGVVYDESTIQTLQNLDHIRQRPTAYLVGRGNAGVVHTWREFVDNSNDELNLRPDGGTIYLGIFTDGTTCQMLIRDDGRGIPSKSLLNVTTKTGTSGKMGANSAYTASSGLFGIGAKVGAALSDRFRVISTNYLEDISASIYLEDAQVISHITSSRAGGNGVTTVFQLNIEKFFPDSRDFNTVGYLDMLHVCRQLNIFNPKINFQFYRYDRLMPEEFWTAGISDAVEIVTDILARPHEVVYSTVDTKDTSAYLFEIWKVNSATKFSDIFGKVAGDGDKLSFSVKYYITRKSSTNNTQYFVAVNNVVLIDKINNSASTVFMDVMRQHISALQPVEEYKTFVLEEYRFPTLLLAIDIRYDGAELTGATKTSFVSLAFAEQFRNDLEKIFSERDAGYWQHIADVLADDIKLRYSQYYDAPATKSANRQIFLNLHYSSNFHECRGDTDCELFIVEGTSAGNIITTRDSNTQAVYITQGKPLNAATDLKHLAENRKKLAAEPIYQDIMTILKINTHSTDMSVSRFKKIIIATDADPDGYHIACLHTHNLFILNPRIIEAGMVYLANPPLYSMNLSKTNRLFLRNDAALRQARVKFIWEPSLDVKVLTADDTIYMPVADALHEMFAMIFEIGVKFEQVSAQLNIPILILERLVLGFETIYPIINYDALSEYFKDDGSGYVKYNYDKDGHYLIISTGDEDHCIGLTSAVTGYILQEILPLDIRYKFRHLTFIVSSKHAGATMKDVMMTPLMLYMCMKMLTDRFHVSRYKGLGEMPTESCFNAIMNPSTRSITQISDIGDIKANYALLGTDTTERKRLLKDNTETLSASFVREMNAQ